MALNYMDSGNIKRDMLQIHLTGFLSRYISVTMRNYMKSASSTRKEEFGKVKLRSPNLCRIQRGRERKRLA
jgi:hypothetical protein